MGEFIRKALRKVCLVLIINIGIIFSVFGFAATSNDTKSTSGAVDSAVIVKDASAEPQCAFGAKFEPPDGRVIHGMGNGEEENEAYLAMLGDKSIYPLTQLFNLELEPSRTWDWVIKKFESYLKQQKKAGRIPDIDLSLCDAKRKSIKWWELGVTNIFGIDKLMVNSDIYDKRIQEIAEILSDFKKPVFLTIGAEFNGRWNGYHPYDYPKAFRKIVSIFKERDANNVVFVWCYQPAAPNDFDEKNSNGDYRWFPGDDVVDWFGVNIFAGEDFRDNYPEFEQNRITRKGKTDRFLKMALDHKKPVMIAHSSVTDIDAKSAEVWDEWFVPYFTFIEKHSQIKAFVYICADWTRPKMTDPRGWLDSRIYLNPSAAAKYIAEMKKDKYLHAGEAQLLKDYKK